MTKHVPVVHLSVMLDVARDLRSLTTGRSNEDIASTDLLGMAVPGGLGRLGVTAARVPADWRNRTSRIDWFKIVDLGRHVIHDYDAIDFDRVVHAVGRLPVLVETLTEALAKLPEGTAATSSVAAPP